VGADLVQQGDQGAGLRLGVDGNALALAVADHGVAELLEEAAGLVETGGTRPTSSRSSALEM